MRTTIDLDLGEPVFHQLKQEAACRGTTLQELVNEYLRRALAQASLLVSMLQLSLLFFPLALCLWGGVCLSAAQQVVIEPHPRYIPSGGRQPFDVTRHSVPLREIRASVARDAIPALTRPEFLSADQADRLLKRSERVLGVALNGEAKAYPLRILNWHELVNDSLGGQPVLVSW
jgi:Protein of unknown function (DUF3179)